MKNKITIKNSVKIIDDSYCIKKKKKDLDKVYNYLLSRSFDYFPEILDEDNENIYYKYINDIDEPKEQKIIDLVNLVSLLHSKTTFYKEIDLDNYKYIYESINKLIDDTYKYYEDIINNIESYVYMSPADYLIARNISMIFGALNYSKRSINSWYKKIENKRRVRVVTVHNDLKIEHYLKEDKPYLISWDKSIRDMPIYDLISLYNNHYLDFDFDELLRVYLSKYPLLEEEMILFLTIISIPYKIENKREQYKMVLSIRRLIDYIYKSSELVEKYGIKEETNES